MKCKNCGKPVSYYSEFCTVIVTRKADADGKPLRGKENDTASETIHDGIVYANCECGGSTAILGVSCIDDIFAELYDE